MEKVKMNARKEGYHDGGYRWSVESNTGNFGSPSWSGYSDGKVMADLRIVGGWYIEMDSGNIGYFRTRDRKYHSTNGVISSRYE